MAAARLLQDFSNDKLQNVETETKEFLKPVFTNSTLSPAEAKGYGNFAAKFLHIAVTKLKNLTDIVKICEHIRTVERCCACYLMVQDQLTLDNEFYMPKLVFHVLNGIKHKECVTDALSLCEQMYSFLSAKCPLSSAGESITQSLFSCLWNLANRLGPQKESKITMATALEIKKHALLILSLCPQKMFERLSEIVSQVAAFRKTGPDSTQVKRCHAITVQIFSDILKPFNPSDESSEVTGSYFKVLGIYMAYLIKTESYSTFEDMCDVVSEDIDTPQASDNMQVLKTMLHLYRLAARIKQLSANNGTVEGDALSKKDKRSSKKEVSCEKNILKSNSDNLEGKESDIKKEFPPHMKETLESFEDFIGKLSDEEFSQLFQAYQFLCLKILVAGKTGDLSGFSIPVIEILLTYTVEGLTAAKFMLTKIQKESTCSKSVKEKDVNGRKPTLKPEVLVGAHQSLLMFCYRSLILSFHLLQNSASTDLRITSLCENVSRVAVEFENHLHMLELSGETMPPKCLTDHRFSCAYICSKIAGYCMRQLKNYDLAILLNTIVLRQLRKCGSNQTKVPVELLVDCYTVTSQWPKAVHIVLESAILDRDVTSCVALWVDLKRNALEERQNGFTQWTLSGLISKQQNHQLDMIELLRMEFVAWKKISGRNFEVEFYILRELVDKLNEGLEGHTYMIELAKNMCMTGLAYKERSPSAVLDELIDKLQDTTPQTQAVLALANFTKYVISHEEAVMDMNTKLQKAAEKEVVNVDETGDTNQNTPDRRKTEGKTNQKTPDKGITLEPTNQGSCFTLATEKPYLKYLHRAVELWEKCMSSGARVDGIDLESHIEAQVACGTRLIVMKQPTFALKILRLAQYQIGNLNDSGFTCHLEERLAKVFMLLGMYGEAEKLITDNSKSSSTTSLLLLKAELFLLMGKKQEGMDILDQVLGQEEGAQKKSVWFSCGSAKRLLSMFLCFPGEHLTGTNSHYLLTLANDAVRRHFTVLNSLDKSQKTDRKSDSLEKLTSVLETLQSLLHLSQLYRLVGLPRKALCYLREGLKIAQAQGLLRWACEFLIEMLRGQSMEADSSGALDTIDGINLILDNKVCSQGTEERSLRELYKQDIDVKQVADKSLWCEDESDVKDSFGFENLAITPKLNTHRSSITPRKDNSDSELSGDDKLKLSRVSVPKCPCSLESSNCSDADLHRLCSEASLVITEFLALADSKTKTCDILHELLGDDKALIDFRKIVSNTKSVSSKWKSKPQFQSSFDTMHLIPSLKYLSLEANCILAEAYSRDSKFNEVKKIWHNVKELDETGFFVDVLHSNILVARLALCEATSFLQSLQISYKTIDFDISITEKSKDSSELELSPEVQDLSSSGGTKGKSEICIVEEKLNDMTLSKKKVTFGEQNEVLVVQETKVKSSQTKGKGSMRKVIADKENNTENDVKINGADFVTPKKKKVKNVLCTPKNQILIHTPGMEKLGASLHTPWSVKNRKMDLDKLLQDSDGDDDMIVFPASKPLTPKSDMPDRRKASKAKTESKKSRQKTAYPSDNIICDLTKAYQASCSPNEFDIKHDKNRPAVDVLDKTKESEEFTNADSETQDEAKRASNQLIAQDDLTYNSPDETKIGEQKGIKESPRLVKGKKAKILKRKSKDADKIKSGEKSLKNNASDDNTSENKSSARKFLSKGIISKGRADKDSIAEESGDAKTGNVSRHDVYDFTGSPTVVNKSKKGQRGKSSKTITDSKDKNSKAKTSVTNRKTVSSGKKSHPDSLEVDSEESNGRETVVTVAACEIENSDEKEIVKTRRRKRNDAVTSKTTAKRTTRDKKAAEEIEIPRNSQVELDLRFNVSLEKIDLKSDSEEDEERAGSEKGENGSNSENEIRLGLEEDDRDSIALGIQEISDRLRDITSGASSLSERIVTEVTSPHLEPIEILRGGRRPRKGERQKRQKSVKSIDEGVSENGSDESEAGVEEMRSSKMPSSSDLSGLLNCSVDVSVRSTNNSGISSPNQQDIIAALENAYRQIRQLAPYPQHSDISQILALHHHHTNPRRAAFLLSDSIAVTFRHQAMLNLNKKARKQKSDTDESVSDSSELQAYIDGLFFNKDENNLQDMIDSIPPEWTVLQLSVVNHGAPHQPVLLTRFARGQGPVVVQIPGFTSPQGRQILPNFSSIIKKNQEVMGIKVKEEWWKIRMGLDTDMKTLVANMEKFWLGHWRALLSPRQFTEETIGKLIKEVKKQTKKELQPCHVEVLLQSVEHLKENELQRCASELLGSHCNSSEMEVIINLLKETQACVEKQTAGHVVLILDKTIQHLPWECLPMLKNHSVSRMPCLSHLYTQLNYLQSQESSIFSKGVNPENTYYILDPDSDLPKSELVFKDWFQSEKGWKGIVGQRPSEEQFAEAITDHDLLLYVGHGTGGRYFHGDEIEKLKGHAAIILMGCSSGKLSVKGQLEPSGMMISYFLAGCPCMVANLWDVTDCDIDKYLKQLLTTWLASENGTLLSKIVQESRQACRMKYLIGCAPVVYGLPVVIRK